VNIPDELRRQLQDMIDKGRRALASAERELAAGDFDFAASRAYYAAFYAAEALLLSHGVTCSTHSGVISEFGKRFVSTGRMTKDIGRKLAHLFRERQTGDYEFGMSIDESDAREDILHARAILDAIENDLHKMQLLNVKT